jgi:nucleoside-diphosphate-sugar epimerase
LNRLVQRLTVAGYRIRHLLSPSSIYVETVPRGMAEYSAAKAASEILCQQFQQQGIRVRCPRWPRMQTDQTASVVPETYADTATVVLNSIRELLDQ